MPSGKDGILLRNEFRDVTWFRFTSLLNLFRKQVRLTSFTVSQIMRTGSSKCTADGFGRILAVMIWLFISPSRLSTEVKLFVKNEFKVLYQITTTILPDPDFCGKASRERWNEDAERLNCLSSCVKSTFGFINLMRNCTLECFRKTELFENFELFKVSPYWKP